jgi:hypothetical protein
VIEALAALGGTVQPEEFEIIKILADSNDGTALGRFTQRVKDTGATSPPKFAVHITVVGGKITRYRIHEDTYAVAAGSLPDTFPTPSVRIAQSKAQSHVAPARADMTMSSVAFRWLSGVAIRTCVHERRYVRGAPESALTVLWSSPMPSMRVTTSCPGARNT